MDQLRIKTSIIMDKIVSTQIEREIMLNASIEYYNSTPTDDVAYISNIIRTIYNHLAYTSTDVATAHTEIGKLVNEGMLISEIRANYKAITSIIINQSGCFINKAVFAKFDNDTVVFNVSYK